jgi:hypothetical protein
MNRFSKASLVVIILLLAVIALRPFLSSQPALAASHFQYLVVTTDPASNAIQKVLDKYVAEGWELAAPVYSEQVPGFTLIFRKEAR